VTHENRVRISLLDAGRMILKHLAIFPETRPAEAARQLSFGPSFLANYDFEAALPLVTNPQERIFCLLGNRSAELRHAIFEIARIDKPFWARAATYGRQRALRLTNEDQAQCLKDAGLADSPLEGEPRVWWERLSNEFRLLQEVERRRIGSEAERLTLEYEKRRLAALGIDKNPHLVSVEDDAAGYDVYSYTLIDARIVPFHIEVKGTSSAEPRFFLSRNEWEACLKLCPGYAVYVWSQGKLEPTVLMREILEGHVPRDCGDGMWMDVRILLKGI